MTYEEDKQDGFRNFLKLQDKLCPALFDDTQKLHPEVRQTLLKIADFMKTYIDNIFINLKIEDVLLVGSIAGYTYSEDSDIDLQVLIKPDEKIITVEEFRHQFAFLNSGLSGRGYKFSIKGYPVDYNWNTEIPPSSGIYSVRDNKWLSQPMKRNYNFTPDDFFEKMITYDQRVQEFMKQLPRNNHNFLTMEAADEAEEFFTNLRKENNQNDIITANGDKEFDINHCVYRCFRRYKKHSELMKLVSQSYADNLSS